MLNRDPKFHKDQRVRIRAEIDPAIYGDFATYGNEGVVKDIRKDRFDLPEVFIQWDKNHWAYNGIEDCWTYEDHFESVKDDMSNKRDKVEKLLDTLLSAVSDDDEPQEPETPQRKKGVELRDLLGGVLNNLTGDEEEVDGDGSNQEYDQAVNAATRRMNESEAFIILGIDRHDHPKSPEGILEPYAMGYSKTPEGDILLASHMAKAAAVAHQGLAIQAIEQIFQHRDA